MDCQTRAAAEKLVLSYYHAFNHGDWNEMCSLLTEDVAHDVNQGETQVGKAVFRAFLASMDLSYREKVEDLVVMAAPDGGRAAAEFFIQGEYLVGSPGLPPASGQKYRLRVGAFFDLKNGLIARVTNYYNLQDWIAQVSGA